MIPTRQIPTRPFARCVIMILIVALVFGATATSEVLRVLQSWRGNTSWLTSMREYFPPPKVVADTDINTTSGLDPFVVCVFMFYESCIPGEKDWVETDWVETDWVRECPHICKKIHSTTHMRTHTNKLPKFRFLWFCVWAFVDLILWEHVFVSVLPNLHTFVSS